MSFQYYTPTDEDRIASGWGWAGRYGMVDNSVKMAEPEPTEEIFHLEDFLQTTYKELARDLETDIPTHPFFTSSAENPSPTLSSLDRDKTHRILLYPGCYNPPHVAHMKTLEHGFHGSGKDLNILAAVVLFVDDEVMDYKDFEIRPGQDLKLSLTERIRLWCKDGDTNAPQSNWYWVFGGLTWEWDEVRTRLPAVLRRAGFKLEFCTLNGPDHVFPGKHIPREF